MRDWHPEALVTEPFFSPKLFGVAVFYHSNKKKTRMWVFENGIVVVRYDRARSPSSPYQKRGRLGFPRQ